MGRQIVVIGAGVGGLSAAIQARLHGFEVLVLEQYEMAGGKAAGLEVSGYRLDPGPSIVILTRLYRDLFQRAGRNLDDYLTFDRLDPITRVFFEEEAPIDLPSSLEACLDLLRGIAPEDAESFRTVFGKLEKISGRIDRSIFAHPYTKPWQLLDPNLIATALQFDVRVSYKELVDRLFRSPLLRAFFYGFPSYGGQSYHSKAAGALMIPYLMLAEGVWYPKGGVAAIPAAMERLAREIGVEFRFGAKVVQLGATSGEVAHATLESGEAFAAEAFVVNVDPLTVGPWLGRPAPDLDPSYSYFTVHWGVRRRMPQLRHHTLFVPADFTDGFEDLYRRDGFPNRTIVYLNATTAVDPSTAPAGAENLFAVITSPAEVPGIRWREDEREFVSRTRAVLRRAGFDWGESEVDFERVQSPPYFRERHGNYRGSLYGAHERYRLWGLFPLGNQDSELGNLYYVGGGVQPGAGLPMVTLSGKFVADQLSRRKG